MRATTVNTACDRIRAVPPPIPQKYNTSQDLAEGQKRGDKKKEKKRCGLVLIYLIQYFRKKQAWVTSVRGLRHLRISISNWTAYIKGSRLGLVRLSILLRFKSSSRLPLFGTWWTMLQ
ncbi:hypothetical protein AB3S75_011272 [Citrus x aurantiifolia]